VTGVSRVGRSPYGVVTRLAGFAVPVTV